MNVNIAGLYRLTGLDADDLNIILPTALIEDVGGLARARALINEAIVEANRATNQGRDGGYFEELQSRLAQHGIQTLAEIESLGTLPWDSDCEDELGDMALANPPEDGFATVEITNVADVFEHQDDESMLCTIVGDDSTVEYSIDADSVAKIDVISMSVEFPRSDRYGVPDCSTDRGGRQYLRDLGFRVPSSVDVEGSDSGDDTPVQIRLVCRVPRELLNPIETESQTEASPIP